MNKNRIDQFFQPKYQAKRYETSGSSDQAVAVAGPGGDAQQEEVQKQNRPFVYILPCHIKPIWSKVSQNLLQIQNRQCKLDDIIRLMKDNYNSHLNKPRNVNLQNLEDLIDEQTFSRREYYQNQLFPSMARIALMLPSVFENQPVLMMLQGEKMEQRFTKQQIASLLANLFFMTTHEQPCRDPETRLPFECSSFYYRSENTSNGAQINSLRKQKIQFLLAYFEKIEKQKINLDLIVSFERLGPDSDKRRVTGALISECDRQMIDVEVHHDIKIEEGQNLIQINFANKKIGGGVLNNGSLQEEIKYLTSPECLVSMLIFEELGDEEAILIQGTEQISNYSGYSHSLQFTGLHDSSYLDIQEENLMLNSITIGIDAKNFRAATEEKIEQYSMPMVLREIRKAEMGFQGSKNILPLGKTQKNRGIITGNWGCGDFGGDPQLKFIIQWIAASLSLRKNLTYCTYNDPMLKIEIEEIIHLLRPYHIQNVYQFLKEFILFKKNNLDTEISLFLYLLTFVN